MRAVRSQAGASGSGAADFPILPGSGAVYRREDDILPVGTGPGFSRFFNSGSPRKLMGRSEAFRDICEELLEAEIALSNVPGTPPELHEARRAEWEELVDRLVAEVGAALLEAKASQNRSPR